MWFAGLAVIAAIAATYQLTRLPELVWWTSPPIGETNHRVRVLIPNGCTMTATFGPTKNEDPVWEGQFLFHATNHLPTCLRWILRGKEEDPLVAVHVFLPPHDKPSRFDYSDGRLNLARLPGGEYQSFRYLLFRESRIAAGIVYNRFDRMAFEATHKTICNSLRIE